MERPAFVEFPVTPFWLLLGLIIAIGLKSSMWPLLEKEKKKKTVLKARAKFRDKILLSDAFKGLSWSLHLKVITA